MQEQLKYDLPTNKKILVGLSGGVDSCVSAILLKEANNEVIAIHMSVHPSQLSAADKAKQIAADLQIPFYHFNLIDEFESEVCAYLREEYLNGKTPNPCALCNKKIKFGIFMQKAKEALGDFDYFATGHYAKVIKLSNGRLTIKKGSDKNKDQAYFLSRLSQEQLSKIIFPLYNLSKDEVRQIAAKHNLEVAKSKESQDLCTGSYLQHINFSSGAGDFIEASSGKVMGRHKGIEHYTIGQRKGLDIKIGYTLFVTKIDKENNIVYVDSEDHLFSKTMRIKDINLVGEDELKIGNRYEFKIRYRDSGLFATVASIEKNGEEEIIKIEFDSPVRAITPGQLAVAYKNDSLSFSGFIIDNCDN